MLSWNVAAINNNPFEYWLTHPDADYKKLMDDVEKFIDAWDSVLVALLCGLLTVVVLARNLQQMQR